MGQAKSKNTVDALAEIANDVVNKNAQKNNQQNSCSASVHLENCDIKGTVQVKNLCSVTDLAR